MNNVLFLATPQSKRSSATVAFWVDNEAVVHVVYTKAQLDAAFAAAEPFEDGDCETFVAERAAINWNPEWANRDAVCLVGMEAAVIAHACLQLVTVMEAGGELIEVRDIGPAEFIIPSTGMVICIVVLGEDDAGVYYVRTENDLNTVMARHQFTLDPDERGAIGAHLVSDESRPLTCIEGDAAENIASALLLEYTKKVLVRMRATGSS